MKILLPLALIFCAGMGFVVTLQGAGTFNRAPATYVATTTTPIVATETERPGTTTQAEIPAPVTASATSEKPAEALKKPVDKPKIAPLVPPPPPTVKVELPYSTPPESLDTVEKAARAALVNILCTSNGGTFRPISGSGVIIDPRGVILTNAHVAQFVLLSQHPDVNLDCVIRNGSPAYPKWKVHALYIPPVWVEEHYKDLNSGRATGTGEHDYALLLVTSDVQGNVLNGPLPYLHVETRGNVTSEGDHLLAAAYPAEFVGGIATQQNLYAVPTLATVEKLMTFGSGTVDVFSIGGVISAQGGSSGGPLVNPWRRVVGIISTTSDGATTADRELHALNLNYIDRDIEAQSGQTLEEILAGNTAQQLVDFSKETAPRLMQKYFDYLAN